MTSKDPDTRSTSQRGSVGPDPVHPRMSRRAAAPDRQDDRGHLTYAEVGDGNGTAPLACDLGVAAVLCNHVVAVAVGSCASPVGIHGWTGTGVSTVLLTPAQAQVWARAGRLTLVSAEGDEYRLTVLAPRESASAVLGEHWPLREPEHRIRRIAAATAHDVGNLLTFPAWLARTANTSGERNHQLALLVGLIQEASPQTALHYGQTFGQEHGKPGKPAPYEAKGLLGHEGWPPEP